MTFDDFLTMAKEYAVLGNSVQEQMDDVLNQEMPLEDLNPNALRYIREFAQRLEDHGVEDEYDLKGTIDSHLKDE